MIIGASIDKRGSARSWSVLFAVLLDFAYVYRGLKVQSAAANRARAELEVKHQAQLAQYQRALPIGTVRSEVGKYLDSRKVVYGDWRVKSP